MSQFFSQLLRMSRQQDQPQRLLFLFARTELAGKNSSKHFQSGALSPVMCVDKLPGELDKFSRLVEEADGVSKDWDIVLIAGLGGQDGKAPSSDDAEVYLNKMTNDVSGGADLSRYMVLNREEEVLEFQSLQ